LGIFAQGTHAHHFLEFDLKPGVTSAEAVAAFRELRTPDVSAGGVNIVIAFGAEAWRGVAPSDAPADLAPFERVTGADGRNAPATQHDAWLWISGAEPDAAWQSARAAAQVLRHELEPDRSLGAFPVTVGGTCTRTGRDAATHRVGRTLHLARPDCAGRHAAAIRALHTRGAATYRSSDGAGK
jgi:hypothetical protein